MNLKKSKAFECSSKPKKVTTIRNFEIKGKKFPFLLYTVTLKLSKNGKIQFLKSNIKEAPVIPPEPSPPPVITPEPSPTGKIKSPLFCLEASHEMYKKYIS